MTARYFTPDEVDRLIPELTRIVGAVMAAHGAVDELSGRLKAEQQRIALAGGRTVDRTAWQAATAEITRRRAEIERGLARIVTLGGRPKDLAIGLVDFPGLLDNDEVNLCWRHGETRVGFWHRLDEGYARRKPLPDGATWN
jgi:hypothetical protein